MTRYGPWVEGGACWLLTPLSSVFYLVSGLRRLAYRLGLLPVTRLPVPVIVVGNISVGGTGKTPLTLWLVARLQAAGYRPGIVSRGYGGRQRGPLAVSLASDPADVGDEPLLLARRARVPVYVGRRRPEAARAMLKAHPDIDVIVADDGLQHYALGRDVEIAVVDGVRRFGNGRLLPAGPLREPPRRLDSVDAVVVNGGTTDWLRVARPIFPMRLEPVRLRRLSDPRDIRGLDWLRGRQLNAVAGIGHPERFFELLRDLGAVVTPHPFPDHHAFRPEDLPMGTVVMTEKDAVKCVAFARADDWLLEVDAVVDPALQRYLLNRLPPQRHGCQTARDPGLPLVQGATHLQEGGPGADLQGRPARLPDS